MQHLLLIEDDERLGALVVEYLTDAGFQITHALTGTEGLARVHDSSSPIDAIILDLMLPDMDGLAVCQKIRATDNTPILMLTARGDAMDRIVGLEMGADDYLPKPFEPRELLARLRAILRRGVSAHNTAPSDALNFGRLSIHPGAREVHLDGQLCEMTSYQYDLLMVLAERAGRVLTREFLIEQLKNQSLEAFDRSIDVHISRLRAVIEDDAKHPKRILTVRGAGYVFAKQQD
ncbi:MAG: response regulator transcription factor [Burkholderiales bacterium]|nr:response regulator transcription factor [Burkholderiales bacterium]